MGILGHLDKYYYETGNISSYLNHVKQFFTVSNIAPDSKLKEILLSAIEGGWERTKFWKICMHHRSQFNRLMRRLNICYSNISKKNTLWQQKVTIFIMLNKNMVTISNFLVHLKNLSLMYEFGRFLKRTLKNKFVC